MKTDRRRLLPTSEPHNSLLHWQHNVTSPVLLPLMPCSSMMKGYSLVPWVEPAEQPAQFAAEDGGIGKAGKQRLDGVQHHALGVYWTLG